MSKGVSKTIIIGNVGKPPEEFENGVGCRWPVAVNESWYDKTTKQKREHTEWFNCVAFGRLATSVMTYVNKGDPLYIEGRIQTREWSENGHKRQLTELICLDVQYLKMRITANGNV